MLTACNSCALAGTTLTVLSEPLYGRTDTKSPIVYSSMVHVAGGEEGSTRHDDEMPGRPAPRVDLAQSTPLKSLDFQAVERRVEPTATRSGSMATVGPTGNTIAMNQYGPPWNSGLTKPWATARYFLGKSGRNRN